VIGGGIVGLDRLPDGSTTVIAYRGIRSRPDARTQGRESAASPTRRSPVVVALAVALAWQLGFLFWTDFAVEANEATRNPIGFFMFSRPYLKGKSNTTNGATLAGC
jgi:hypothetical protein